MNYSIHTIELRKEFRNHIEFNQMLGYIYKLAKGRYKVYRKDNDWFIEMFKGKGIRVVMRETKISGYIIFIISLNDLMGTEDKLSLIDPNHLQNVLTIADEMLSVLGAEYSVNSLELSRVDYCINVDVGSGESVSAYIKLLYLSDMKKGYKIIGMDNEAFDSSKGFTARNQNYGMEISFYDKQKQLEQRKYENSETAAGILRIELRLTRPKSVLEHTPGCSDNKQRIEHCIRFSRQEILSIVRQLVPDGDYYTMKKAQKIITKSVINKKLRERMITMLRLARKYGSIRLAKKEMFKAYPKMKHEYFNMMMEEFERIGVNPVILGKEFGICYLISLFQYLQ